MVPPGELYLFVRGCSSGEVRNSFLRKPENKNAIIRERCSGDGMDQSKQHNKEGARSRDWFYPVMLTAIFAPIILVAMYGAYTEGKWGFFVCNLILGGAFLTITHMVFHSRRKRLSNNNRKNQKLYQ